jgi:quinoprotein glucose dehydrogenase
MRWTYAFVAVPALIGAALGALAYFGEGTGVNGTGGALVAFLGALGVGVGALLALPQGLPRWWRTTLDVLIALGALLTAFAAWMLMQNGFAAVMLLSFAGLIIALASPAPRRTV